MLKLAKDTQSNEIVETKVEVKPVLIKRQVQPKKSRNGNYKLLEKEVLKEFIPVKLPDDIGTCGNIDNEIEPMPNWRDNNWEKARENRFHRKISAPYLLATLCAIFKGLVIDTEGQEGYKVTWFVALQHKQTGKYITFYDYKGGTSYGSDYYPAKRKSATDKQFLKDVKTLLKIISDERFPHPYDGCVIGEEA